VIVLIQVAGHRWRGGGALVGTLLFLFHCWTLFDLLFFLTFFMISHAFVSLLLAIN